jgi:DNA primase
LIVEGEFNALAALQHCARDGLIWPVSVGSAGGSIGGRWLARLASASQIIALFDDDQAGQGGRERMKKMFWNVRFVQVPTPHKDMNDFVAAGNAKMVIEDWLAQCP